MPCDDATGSTDQKSRNPNIVSMIAKFSVATPAFGAEAAAAAGLNSFAAVRTEIRQVRQGERIPATNHWRSAIPRLGISLIELLLVVAILSVVVAIAWPSLRRPISRNHIETAARQVQADLLKARSLAMRQREMFVFFYRYDADQYVISSLRSWQKSGVPSALDSIEDERTAESATDRIRGLLPEGIRFARQDKSTAELQREGVPQDSNRVDRAESTSGDTENRAWSEMILFFPSGGLQSKVVQLASDQGYLIELRLDGFGGRIRIENLRRESSDGETQQTAERPHTHSPADKSKRKPVEEE